MSRKYKLGDRFRNDFDYDGMVEMALQTNSTWSISDLQKLYDSMEDVNYHTANKYLGSAIFALENDLPDVADIKFEKFHKELEDEEEEDDEIHNVTEPVFKGEEKKIFEFGKNIKNISQLKELTKFPKIDTSDNFTSVIQFLEINGYNKKLIDLLYKWQESQKTDTSGWFEISKNFYEKYRADGKRYNDGGEMADGGETLKNYQVIGTVSVEIGGTIPPEADREDYIDIETEKFSISVMASSEAEAERIAEEEMMDKYLLDEYGTSLTGRKQYTSGSVEIEDVIETGRYAKGGSINKRKKYTYIPKEEIESITTWNGKNITQEKILDGAYVRGNVKYDNGGETDSQITIEQQDDERSYGGRSNIKVYYEKGDIGFDGHLNKYHTGRGYEYEFEPDFFNDDESEKYYEDNTDYIEEEILNVFYSKFKKGGQVKRNKYGEGGSVEQGNLEMMKNQAIQVQHHAEELIEILKSNPRVDAWVVSLMDRATQNLSNITHYLDGELKHFAKGGNVDGLGNIKSYRYNFDTYITIEGTNYGGKLKLGYGARIVGGRTETYPYLSEILWDDNNVPDNSEEIENFVDKNLDNLLNTAN